MFGRGWVGGSYEKIRCRHQARTMMIRPRSLCASVCYQESVPHFPCKDVGAGLLDSWSAHTLVTGSAVPCYHSHQMCWS